MNNSIAAKLTQICVRLEELTHLLSSETATANLDNYRKLTRERAEIAPVVELYQAYQQSERDILTAQEMSGDLAMREFAEAEIRTGRESLVRIEAELQKQLLPKDANDERNIFLEIRAGTGGTSLRCSRAIYSVCMHASPSVSAGRWKSFHKTHQRRGDTKKLSQRSSVKGHIQN